MWNKTENLLFFLNFYPKNEYWAHSTFLNNAAESEGTVASSPIATDSDIAKHHDISMGFAAKSNDHQNLLWADLVIIS
jgi:hypothetical protein